MDQEYDSLPSAAFADPTARLYPINSAEDTWLSIAYFSKYGTDYPDFKQQEVAERLAQAAGLWKIELPVSSQQKEAAEPYTVYYKIGNETKASMQIRDPKDLLRVADDLHEKIGHYPYDMRKGVSQQILAAPPALRVSITAPMEALLQKTAGYGICGLEDAMEFMRARSVAYQHYYPVREDKFEDKLAGIADDVAISAAGGFVPADMLEKLARLTDAMDRLVGLHQKWGPSFLPPEQELFRITPRDMDDFKTATVVLANGDVVTKTAVKDNNVRGFLENYLGEKLASHDAAITRLLQLNAQDASIVSEYLAACPA